jgi:TonB family protein
MKLAPIAFALTLACAAAAQAETSRLDTVSVRAGFEAPRVVEAQPLPYPRVALHERAEGKVVVVAVIGADGAVGAVEVDATSGRASLDRAAVALVKAQRYAPAQLDAQPIAVHARIPVTFALQSQEIDTRIAAIDLQ